MAEKKNEAAGSSFWQIVIPAILSGIVIILICVWVVIEAGEGSVTRFAEISTVLLVIPVLFLSLITLIILGAGIVLTGKLMEWLPPITQRFLEYLDKAQELIKKFTEFIVQPVIRPSALLGGIKKSISREKSRYRIE